MIRDGLVTQERKEIWHCWHEMKEDVQAYVKTCHVCQVDKTEQKKEAGLLQPLSIPEKPWQCVSMDFISGFPKLESFGSALVVVDRFSKYDVFIPAPSECPTEEAAHLLQQCCETLWDA